MIELELIVSLYQQVGNSNIDCREQFTRHMDYMRFRECVCLNEGENPIGFAYGYAFSIGAKNLKPDLSNEWLINCFEFVEIFVHPSMCQKGFGSLLYDSLLKDMPFETSVLTTQQSNSGSRKLYDKKGWIVIDDAFFPDQKTKEQYLLFGKKLS